ncbi:MAG: hypothetical protein AB8H80_01250 [Planctomycetota bacterium]
MSYQALSLVGRTSSVLFSAALTSLLAQTPLPPCPPQYLTDLEMRAWSGLTPTTSDVHQLTAGSFHASGYPDVAFLEGARVRLMVAPCMVHQIIDLPVTNPSSAFGGQTLATELCHIPGGAIGNDELALLVPGGLEIWSAASASAAGRNLVAYGDTTFSGARELNYVRGMKSLVAIASDDQTIVSVATTSGVTSSFPVGAFAESMVTLDWDNDGIDELAVATPLGLRVFELNGNLDLDAPYPMNDAQLVRVPSPLGDMVGLLAQTNAGTSFVTVGTNWQEQAWLPSDIVSAAALPSPNNGWRNLLLGSNQRSSADFLINQAPQGLSQFLYDPTRGVETILSTQPENPLNRAAAVDADLDGDGYGDLLYPVAAEGAFAYQSSPFTTHVEPIPKYVGFNYTRGQSSGMDQVTIDLGVVTVPADATHVECRVFSCFIDQGVIYTLAELANSRDSVVGGVPDKMTPFCIPGYQIDVNGIQVVLRFATLVNGTVTRAFPSSFTYAVANEQLFSGASNLPGVSLVIPGGIGGQSDTGGIIRTPGLQPPADDDDDADVVVGG